MNRQLMAVLAILVLAAGCVGAAQPATDDAPEEVDGPTLSATASGTAEAAPDLAVVHLAVEARADSAEAARADAAERVASVREALASLVGEDAVTTTSYYLHVEYDYDEDEGREPTGYRAVHALRVEAPVDAAGQVVDAAVEAGANRVSGVQFTLSDDARQALREEALTAAMSDARSDAEAMASAAGLTITNVEHASTTDVGYPRPYSVYAERGAADAGAPTTFDPGQVTVTATVTVTYAATQA